MEYPGDGDTELTPLLEALCSVHGVDLRGYAQKSLSRRVRSAMLRRGVHSLSELSSMLADRTLLHGFLDDLTIPVSAMFRDPAFYLAFRRHAVPLLRQQRALRVWSAGCAGGEEAYALAILLEEEGLYDRAQIFATDLSGRAIARAKQGIFSARNTRLYTENYLASGGVASFSNYYTARYDQLVVREPLRRNVLFLRHDLIGDEVLRDMHVVLCRNVLIYFDAALRQRVLLKLRTCLTEPSLLCLGSSERVPLAMQPRAFSELVPHARIYQVLEASPRGIP